jgi:hypothetical protein
VSWLGLGLRMDVLYFTAILLGITLSLVRILRSLGLRLADLAQTGVPKTGGLEADTAKVGAARPSVVERRLALECV